MSNTAWPLAEGRFEAFAFSSEIKRALAELRPDNITGALYIAKDYLVMAACIYITLQVSWWFYPLAVLLIGAHQRGLTTISHDAAHRTLARNPTLNYTLGILFAAYPLFQRHWAYRVSHVHLHHPHLGNPTKDPDLKFFLQSGVYDVVHPMRYLWRIVIAPVLGGATISYLKFLFTSRFRVMNDGEQKPNRLGIWTDTIGFAAFWITVLGVAGFFGWLDELVLFWIVPYLTTFQILGWFIEIAEHSPLCEGHTSNVYLTRNRKGNWLERILLGVNLDEYHLEHHLSPGIPFWHLKRAQKIRMADPTYAQIARTWGGLFVRGPEGQPSVLAQLMERNERLYFEAKYRAATPLGVPA